MLLLLLQVKRRVLLMACAQGVCKLNGFTVLVDNALPGEQLHAEVTAVKGGKPDVLTAKQGTAMCHLEHMPLVGYATATKTETVKEHEGAVQAPCRYFGTCGGCSLQYLDYSLQLQYKDAQITDALQRLGKQQHAAAVRKPPLAAASPYHFRNKVWPGTRSASFQPACSCALRLLSSTSRRCASCLPFPCARSVYAAALLTSCC